MTTDSQYFEPLAVAIAAGKSVRLAVDGIGISESHAYRLSRSPEFRYRVSELRSEVTSQAVGRLAAAASQAVDALVELLSSEDSRDRLAAAKAILAALGPMSELGELRSRIDALERAA